MALFSLPVLLNDGGGSDKKGTETYVYISNGKTLEQKYVCHSLSLGVGGAKYEGKGGPLIVNQPEAGGIFKNTAFFEPVRETDPIKVGDVLVFYARSGMFETPFHSSLVTKVPPTPDAIGSAKSGHFR